MEALEVVDGCENNWDSGHAGRREEIFTCISRRRIEIDFNFRCFSNRMDALPYEKRCILSDERTNSSMMIQLLCNNYC